MSDEDLEALHHTLRRMGANANITIGSFRCTARELDWVVEEAIGARLITKAAGTYDPYKPLDN